MSKTKKIAITGMMGAGKSEVSSYLFSKGYLVISSDEIVADLYQYDKTLIEQLQALTSESIVTNQQIDKTKLKTLIFQDEIFKKKVEQLVHEQVKQSLLVAFKTSPKPIVFVEVPLLFESGLESLFDIIICIDIDPKVQLERLIHQRNFTQEEANIRLNAQLNRAQKCQKAHFVIDNSTTKQALYQQIEKVCRRLENDLKQHAD